MNIKCIALDLDRTTLNEEGRLSPGNRAALEYAISRGVHVVVASGRSFSALPRDVLAVPGIEYAITSNGAAVYHVPIGQRLHSYVLTPASVEAILDLTAGESVAYEAFVDGCPYAGAGYVADPLAYGATPQSLPYIQSTRTPVEDITAFIRQHRTALDSLDLVVGSQADKDRIWDLLRRSVPDIYLTSSVQQLIEISHRDAGKHSGVRFITELLGIDRDQTAAFGDGDNDADMLAAVGCGIAMANASPACLAAADRVTLHHGQDGVAHGIYYILEL